MPKTAFSKVIPSKRLEDSLRVGQAIVDYNGGKPIDKLTLAESMKLSPTSSTFIQLVSSSQMYGLTVGSAHSKVISLTQLGKDLFYPMSEEEKQSALLRVATNPPLVKSIYEHFNNNKLPPFDIAKNILIRNFDMKDDKTEVGWKILLENAKFIGILHKIQGNDWINLAKISKIPLTKKEREEKAQGEDKTAEGTFESGYSGEPPIEKLTPENIRVFISHGKNHKILEQIKTTLRFGGFEPIIAEEQETTAIPVPEKVMNAMHVCMAGIINISADETIMDKEGNKTYKINENVLIEIGAAFVLYKKKVILVVDKRVTLPSNLKGLYLCYYEGDSFDWESGLKLQKALTEFKN